MLGALLAHPALASAQTAHPCDALTAHHPMQERACRAVARSGDDVRVLRTYLDLRDLVAEIGREEQRDLRDALLRTMRGLEDVRIVRTYLNWVRVTRDKII